MEKAIFSRIHRFQHTSYADTEGMRENGYEGMLCNADARGCRCKGMLLPCARDDNQLISLWRDILSQGSPLAT